MQEGEYKKKCWNCKEAEMLPDERFQKGWFVCPKCGATWVEVSEPYQAVTEEAIKLVNGRVLHHIKARVTGRKKRATNNSEVS